MITVGNPSIGDGAVTLTAEQEEASTNRNYSDLAAYSDAINESWSSIKGHVFAIGRNLEEAFKAITGKKQKATWNAWVAETLPFSQSTAEKLRRIYKKELLRDNQDMLPIEWATLNQLAYLEDKKLKTFLADGTIRPQLSRAEASALRGKKSVEFIAASPNQATWTVDKIRRYRDFLLVRVGECDALLKEATPKAVNE